ncbi:unnamed protein product, partial [Brachionus calyciflorus]
RHQYQQEESESHKDFSSKSLKTPSVVYSKNVALHNNFLINPSCLFGQLDFLESGKKRHVKLEYFFQSHKNLRVDYELELENEIYYDNFRFLISELQINVPFNNGLQLIMYWFCFSNYSKYKNKKAKPILLIARDGFIDDKLTIDDEDCKIWELVDFEYAQELVTKFFESRVKKDTTMYSDKFWRKNVQKCFLEKKWDQVF